MDKKHKMSPDGWKDGPVAQDNSEKISIQRFFFLDTSLKIKYVHREGYF